MGFFIFCKHDSTLMYGCIRIPPDGNSLRSRESPAPFFHNQMYLYNMDVIITESQYKFLINDATLGSTKYTKDVLSKIALQYRTKKEFERGNQGAYQAAIKFGPCYDLTTKEEVPCKIWSKEKNYSMYRPNTKNTFGFLESITTHMETSDYGEKLVYSFTFYDDDDNIVGVYVGITNDEERRRQEHLTSKTKFTDKEVKSAVNRFINENPNFRVEFTKLSDLSDYATAKDLEKKYVDIYKDNGYRVLNIAKTGGGGRTFMSDDYFIQKAQDWVKMKLEKGEVPYFGEYENFDHTNYNAVRRRKLMDDAFKGMVYMDRKKYSDDDIFNIAMSSDSYTDFYNKYRKTIAQQANRRGLSSKIKQMFEDGLNTPDQITPSI